MAIFVQGDMWSAWDEADLFVITTNATLKKDGALVMGRGIAVQARDRFPGLDLALGHAIGVSGREYGLLVSPRWPRAKLGAFQVKHHYYERASLRLIRRATGCLAEFIAARQPEKVVLNFPGIGNGGLRREDVLPIVTQLPDCVTIYER
jgi:hypothetical protein